MGKIAKWGTVLGAFDIKYMPRTSVKGQVLADLVAEFTTQNMDGKSVGTISLQEPSFLKVYIDGAANQRGSRVASSNLTREAHHIKITKIGLLSHE